MLHTRAESKQATLNEVATDAVLEWKEDDSNTGEREPDWEKDWYGWRSIMVEARLSDAEDDGLSSIELLVNSTRPQPHDYNSMHGSWHFTKAKRELWSGREAQDYMRLCADSLHPSILQVFAAQATCTEKFALCLQAIWLGASVALHTILHQGVVLQDSVILQLLTKALQHKQDACGVVITNHIRDIAGESINTCSGHSGPVKAPSKSHKSKAVSLWESSYQELTLSGVFELACLQACPCTANRLLQKSPGCNPLCQATAARVLPSGMYAASSMCADPRMWLLAFQVSSGKSDAEDLTEEVWNTV